MNRNAWILLLVLICVAFLVSCGKKDPTDAEKAELVRTETPGEYPGVYSFYFIDRNTGHCVIINKIARVHCTEQTV